MSNIVPVGELNNRMARFRTAMDRAEPDWEAAVFFGKINQFYFTGTMQDGMLIIPRDGTAVFWVRRSWERAEEESVFPDIRPMESYREAAEAYLVFPSSVHVETEIVPIAMIRRFQKYFRAEKILQLDGVIASVRSVKSAYELERMKKSGEIHRRVLEVRVPELLREGISEAELGAAMFSVMLEEGYHGITRFSMFDTEMALGQMAFGTNSLCPTYFNGPGGCVGLSAAVPILGSRERKLQKGDLVFLDTGCGFDGYHSDKTSIYVFGGKLPDAALDAHKRCVEIQNEIASMLKPGEIPAHIYKTVMGKLSDEFLENFMGFGKRKVKFLGHSIGLQIDESPVIADGFREPLCEGMVFALEPKKGIAGIGMVGTENTFLVTTAGGVCITGKNYDPIYVREK